MSPGCVSRHQLVVRTEYITRYTDNDHGSAMTSTVTKGHEQIPDMKAIGRHIRDALIARADRLGLDPLSVASPSRGVVTARVLGGGLLRLDVSTYSATELER